MTNALRQMIGYPRYLTLDELVSVGVKFSGLMKNIFISSAVTLPNPEGLTVADNVRVDANVLMSIAHGGRIILGNYVHIARKCDIYAGTNNLVEFGDFSAISGGCMLYGVTDNYDGTVLTNPTADPRYRGVISGDIILNDHVIVGTASVILPKCDIPTGTAIGAQSLISSKKSKEIQPWSIWAGNPLKYIGSRDKTCYCYGQVQLLK